MMSTSDTATLKDGDDNANTCTLVPQMSLMESLWANEIVP